MKTSERVLFNTVSLYLKMIVTTIISLYLTRVVLSVLGVEDYGIFNLIGGVVALLSFVSTALMVSTQRYLSVAMGHDDIREIRNIYVSSVFIHVIFTAGILIILELCTLFLFDGFLNIAPDRIDAAKIVYQLMIVSTLVTIMGVPYNAEINAHEDLWFFSIVETICTILKLLVIYLFDNVELNNLILYTLWIAIISVINTVIKYLWCKIKYQECYAMLCRKELNIKIFKGMIGFTGWNAFGTLALVGRNQGVAIVLNICWGTIVNAVYGIANQVNGQLIYFSTMMTTSMTPQIMKSYGEGNYERMWRLSVFASKLAYYLSAVFAIPLIVELDYVLEIWLKNVPLHTSIFCELMILMFLVMQLNPGIVRAIQATGKIKKYQLWSALLMLAPIPIGFILHGYGFPSYSTLYAMIVAQIAQLILSIIISVCYTGFNARKFALYLMKAIVLSVIVYIIGELLQASMSSLNRFVAFIVCCITTGGLFTILYFLTIFNKIEKESIKSLTSRLSNKILKSKKS